MKVDARQRDATAATGQAVDRPLVLGVSDVDWGDNVAGLLAAEEIRAACGDEIEVSGATAEPEELIESWSHRDTVVVVSTIATGAPPGTVHRMDASEGRLPVPAHGRHAVRLAAALARARPRRRLPARLIVYGIEGRHYSEQAGVSPEVDGAVRAVVERVQAEVAAPVR